MERQHPQGLPKQWWEMPNGGIAGPKGKCILFLMDSAKLIFIKFMLSYPPTTVFLHTFLKFTANLFPIISLPR